MLLNVFVKENILKVLWIVLKYHLMSAFIVNGIRVAKIELLKVHSKIAISFVYISINLF